MRSKNVNKCAHSHTDTNQSTRPHRRPATKRGTPRTTNRRLAYLIRPVALGPCLSGPEGAPPSSAPPPSAPPLSPPCADHTTAEAAERAAAERTSALSAPSPPLTSTAAPHLRHLPPLPLPLSPPTPPTLMAAHRATCEDGEGKQRVSACEVAGREERRVRAQAAAASRTLNTAMKTSSFEHPPGSRTPPPPA